MRSFLDAKAMAKTLRQELQHRKIDLGHSECLEVIAKQFGFRDWNTMAAAGPERDELTKTGSRLAKPLPAGWSATGKQAEAFDVGVTSLEDANQKGLFIRSRDKDMDARADAFCAVQQVISAENYRGGRVEFSSTLKCTNIAGSATIWMRVEDINGTLVAFENLERAIADSSLRGTQDWTRRKIVLFVPEKAEVINFGFYLNGKGEAWAKDFRFVQTDEIPSNAGILKPKEPQNLQLA